MRVLGIDPGSHKTGWGVVESVGSSLRHIDSGTIHCAGADLPARLLLIADGLDEILRRVQPDAVVIEAMFHAKNSQSAIKLGHARGVALLCAARSGAEVHEYSPTEIKRAATGHGRASKEQVQKMVCSLLAYRGKLGFDASDALAAAICHIHAAPMRARLEAAAAAQTAGASR